jgi:hypothetical protein
MVDMGDDREVADVTRIHFVAGWPQYQC